MGDAQASYDRPLDARSWVGLATFFVVVGFCIFPVSIRLPRGYHLPIDIAVAPILGVALLGAIGAVGTTELHNGFIGSGTMQPYAIVILIFSLAVISLSIDLTGAFGHVALLVAKSAGHSGPKLWRSLFFLSALIATFFSNDVVVLTLTPIILYFLEAANIPATPFLLPAFQVANVGSILLVLGNPTNILVAQGTSLSFLAYTAWMALPTVVALCTSYLLLYVLFRSRTPANVDLSRLDELRSNPRYQVRDWAGAWFGSFCMCGCLITLMVATVFDHSINVAVLSTPWAGAALVRDLAADIWKFCGRGSNRLNRKTTAEPGGDMKEAATSDVSIGDLQKSSSAVELDDVSDRDPVLEKENGSNERLMVEGGEGTSDSKDLWETKQDCVKVSIEKVVENLESREHLDVTDLHTRGPLPTLWAIMVRLPWKIAPFAIGMFILVESLDRVGWLERFAWATQFLMPNYAVAVVTIGIVSTLLCNVTCNLPMTILLVRILNHPNAFPFTTNVAELANQDVIRQAALWGVVIGANIGGNVTPLGALAGLMWLDILRRFDVKVPWRHFVYYGVLTSVGVLVTSLAVVVAEMAVMQSSLYQNALAKYSSSG
ncbi:hypothetical protein M427DRAFT_59463 [Gonapodya prolifera JEL478]|uniref:Citrate transporter-like domain-containing protein n=1 Tax=Gonapodya prolifera (strain JEL478) TaxID=1344416 RepID=A0A139A6X4_GONPJ|nr:hypothetical protein M427DRAFT_59463 [Gonapodya prolifera JEL478]|eukprot:KXS12521.1 hypothetical protein M427DRAFT_59463 [Gonapodya prolifera JEL478]